MAKSAKRSRKTSPRRSKPAARQRRRPSKTAKPGSTRSAGKRSAAQGRVAKGRTATPAHPLMGPMTGTERRDIGHVTLDVARTGAARVKRMVYPPGFHWAKDMKPSIGTDLCMHAHVGFLAQGEIHIEYADGCIVECRAPQVVAIEPGHDGWVVGTQPVVLIEFDFEGDTVARLGMPDGHRH
jgi:hypothetical protein